MQFRFVNSVLSDNSAHYRQWFPLRKNQAKYRRNLDNCLCLDCLRPEIWFCPHTVTAETLVIVKYIRRFVIKQFSIIFNLCGSICRCFISELVVGTARWRTACPKCFSLKWILSFEIPPKIKFPRFPFPRGRDCCIHSPPLDSAVLILAGEPYHSFNVWFTAFSTDIGKFCSGSSARTVCAEPMGSMRTAHIPASNFFILVFIIVSSNFCRFINKYKILLWIYRLERRLSI